jgi:hypothetical protein
VYLEIRGGMKENSAWIIRYNNELYKQSEEPSTSNVSNRKTTMDRSHPAQR